MFFLVCTNFNPVEREGGWLEEEGEGWARGLRFLYSYV